jgi:SAM-dependent methyltransferase
VTVDQTQWQVAGSAPEVYERELVPAVFGPWAPLVIALADLEPEECVLDLACGTGVVARIAAEKVGERGAIVAADLNPGMVTVARSLQAPAGATIEWREADAGALPFAGEAFDAVLCQLGLQSSPTGRPLCARCIACCAQAGVSSSWSGARSTDPLASAPS